MQEPEYGTDHERYIASGIIGLSQIKPHPKLNNHHLFPQFKKDQEKLKQQFSIEPCKPWLNENHLKVEVSQSQWENRVIIGWQKMGEVDFPSLRFKEDSPLYITEGVELLEVGRSSNARDLVEDFDLLEPKERWWVVDFFGDVDGSDSRPTTLGKEYNTVRSILCATMLESEARGLPYNSSLTPNIKEAKLVRDKVGVVDAFRPLNKLPSMWITKSFGYITYFRKCWCIEECINYIQAIVSQWGVITLNWHERVLPCIDLQSIRDLQSRAPRFSIYDEKFIVNSFKSGKMLSKLTDDTLRARVMTAVCDQGPILTLETFAKDILLLLNRVHKSMEPMVEKMDGDLNETLRKRICKSLEKEFVILSSSSGLFVDTTIQENEFFERQKKEFVKRCYQHVFLHTIRNETTTEPIDRTLLSNFARSEFNHIYAKEGHHGVCSPTTNKDTIIARAPADVLLDVSGWQDVYVSKRHGSTLFKKKGATELLYYDQVHTDPLPGVLVPITSSFMATHIVRVFLLGAAANAGAQPQSGMSDRLSFYNSSPASSRAFDGSDPVLPLCAAGRLSPIENLIEKSVPRFRRGSEIVPVNPKAAVRSEVASRYSSSPIGPTDTSKHTTKRPLPASATNEPQNDWNGRATPVKRPRQLTASTDEGTTVSEPGSTHSMKPVTPRYPLSATFTTSPSICSLNSQMSQRPFSCGTGRKDTMLYRFPSQYKIGNPFSDGDGTSADMSSVGQISPLSVSVYGSSQYSIAISPSRYRSEQATAESPPRQVTYGKPEKWATVMYHLEKRPNLTYKVLREEGPTNRFVKNQLQADADSQFLYKSKGMMKYVTGDLLYDTIDKGKVKDVLVRSKKFVLASLESNPTIWAL